MGLRKGRCTIWSTWVPQCSVLRKSVGGADLDSLAAAAVHNAAVSASSWPKSKRCGRRRWRGRCWRGLSLFQESICIQGLQREFIKVVRSYKEKHRPSSYSIYITTKASQNTFCFQAVILISSISPAASESCSSLKNCRMACVLPKRFSNLPNCTWCYQ